MKLKLFSLLTFIFTVINLSAQRTNDKIADGYWINSNYEKALPLYKSLYESDSSNVTYTYRLGVCHLMLSTNRAQAIPFLEKASKMSKVPNYVFFDLGSAYRYSNQLDKAKESIEKYQSMTILSKEKESCRLMLQQIENAKQLMANPVNVTFVNMGKFINSPWDDWAPQVSSNNQWILFNSKRAFSKLEDRYINNIYMVNFKHKAWGAAQRPKSVNTSEDIYLVGKGAKDDCLFVRPQQFLNLTGLLDEILFVDIVKGNIGTKPVILPEPIKSSSIQNGITISTTKDTIIFSSDRKGGMGGLDLYMTVKTPVGKWSEPKNLQNFNTQYDDDYPVLSEDGKTLWFASQGHNSMGGFDIFEAKFDEQEQTWSNPRNLGYPINNFYDNYTISFTKNKRYAYVSDSRSDSHGGYDIYQLIFNDIEAPLFLVTGKLFSGNEKEKKPVSENSHIKITVYRQEDKTEVGEYSYNYKRNHFTLTLFPGEYTLKIKSNNFQTFEHNFEVLDVYIEDNTFELGDFFLEAKK